MYAATRVPNMKWEDTCILNGRTENHWPLLATALGKVLFANLLK